ncbi:MAG: hypothetical protein AB7P40_28890 [Chloroflexota bacterium]
MFKQGEPLVDAALWEGREGVQLDGIEVVRRKFSKARRLSQSPM